MYYLQKKVDCQGKKEHFWHIFLFDIYRRVKESDAARTICVVYEENTIGENLARKLFFSKEEHLNMNDAPRSGTPFDFDNDRLYLGDDP